MDYLKQFNKDFWENKIIIQNHYNHPEQEGQLTKTQQFSQDVITDLINCGKPISAACLPIAKQIVTSDQQMTLKLPRIGDIFIGILHQPIIKKVTLTINNYNESVTIDGILRSIGNQSIWVFSEYPIPLICINDYEHIYPDVNIYLNSTYSLQTANQDVFKAFYGYFNQSIQYQAISQIIYEIPLLDQTSCLKMICGIWTIKTNGESKDPKNSSE